jgi:3-phosphoshikimate 1-carboxyvinyltransferase
MARAREIPSGRRLEGSVRVPASKSVTNRYLNLALLAGSSITLERPLESEDTAAMSTALGRLGWLVSEDRESLILTPGELPREASIDCGASGTMARFLTASLAATPGLWRLDGSPRLRERPLSPLLAALREQGAGIECDDREGYLPVRIQGEKLCGGRVVVDAGASSQYASALMMAASRAAETTRIEVVELASAPYVDLTASAMSAFGARVAEVEARHGARAWRVDPGIRPRSLYRVEGDFSAAAYFAAAAVLTRGMVEIVGVGRHSLQGDRRFLDLLGEMGAGVDWRGSDRLVVSATAPLVGIDVDMSEIPDQVPTLAAIAPFAAGTTIIRNVAHLRIKESDRLAACAAELERLGAQVEERDDGLEVAGSWAGISAPADPVTVNSWDDHRIAMSFAVLGLRRPGVRIADPGVVAKSYPRFWKDLDSCLMG